MNVKYTRVATLTVQKFPNLTGDSMCIEADDTNGIQITMVDNGFIVESPHWRDEAKKAQQFLHIPMAQVQYAHGVLEPEPANDNGKKAEGKR